MGNGEEEGLSYLKNQSSRHVFLEFAGKKPSEKNIMQLREVFGDLSINISAVYASNPKDMLSYFAAKSDVLVIPEPLDEENQLSEILREYGFEMNATRSRYLSGKQVYEAKKAEKSSHRWNPTWKKSPCSLPSCWAPMIPWSARPGTSIKFSGTQP